MSYTAELPGPPSALQLFYNDGGEEGDKILYGTEDGKVGVMTIGIDHPEAGLTAILLISKSPD